VTGIIAVCISCLALLIALVAMSRPATMRAERLLASGNHREAFRVAVSALYVIPWPWLWNSRVAPIVGRWLADSRLLQDLAAEALWRNCHTSQALVTGFEDLSRRLCEARNLVQTALIDGRCDLTDSQWDTLIIEFARSRRATLRLASLVKLE
jgi:hypothetical protein